MQPVRRDASLSTSLRIRRQFSPGVSHPRLFFFAYAGGGGINPARGRHGGGEDGRYAPPPLGIRSERHHRGAYLRENVEICAADP